MIIDNGLRLATTEVTPNGGAAPGGLGPASVTLALQPGGVTTSFRGFSSIGAGERIQLNFTITTTFAAASIGTLEIQLVSLPIAATLLTDATTTGKTLTKTLAALTIATDTVTLVGHDLPLGTPIYLTTIVTTTGVTASTIYYVVPIDANSFALATTLANAVAIPPVLVDLLTNNGTATVNFVPTIHASTGGLPIYNLGSPTNQGPLRSGNRFSVPVASLSAKTGVKRLPPGAVIAQPVPGGMPAGVIAASAQRFYYLRYVPSVTITAGALTCDLSILEPGDALHSGYPTAFEVIG